MRLSLSLLAKQFVMSSNDGCPYCGWSEEYPECHVHLAPFCPTVRAEYQVWVDDDGELCSRKRDFLWMLPVFSRGVGARSHVWKQNMPLMGRVDV